MAINQKKKDDDEGFCLDHADVNDQGLVIDQQIGDDLVSFWKREIDKFPKEMTLEKLLLPDTLTYLYHQSEDPASSRRIRISRCIPRITITSDQTHDLQGVQVEENGRLERGYVTSYANSLWIIKYTDRVPNKSRIP